MEPSVKWNSEVSYTKSRKKCFVKGDKNETSLSYSRSQIVMICYFPLTVFLSKEKLKLLVISMNYTILYIIQVINANIRIFNSHEESLKLNNSYSMVYMCVIIEVNT